MNNTNKPLQVFFWGALGYCPNCFQRRIFKNIYAVRQYCPHCGQSLEDGPGEFTGTAYVNAFLTSLIGVLVGMALVLLTDIGLVPLFLLSVPLVFVIATVLHQPLKGLWIALMYYTHALPPPGAGDF